MTANTAGDTTELAPIDADTLEELTRRVQDISNDYRTVARKMGQLYIRADESGLSGLTRALDKPMRNASENEQMFAAILEDLNMKKYQRARPFPAAAGTIVRPGARRKASKHNGDRHDRRDNRNRLL